MLDTSSNSLNRSFGKGRGKSRAPFYVPRVCKQHRAPLCFCDCLYTGSTFLLLCHAVQPTSVMLRLHNLHRGILCVQAFLGDLTAKQQALPTFRFLLMEFIAAVGVAFLRSSDEFCWSWGLTRGKERKEVSSSARWLPVAYSIPGYMWKKYHQLQCKIQKSTKRRSNAVPHLWKESTSWRNFSHIPKRGSTLQWDNTAWSKNKIRELALQP